MKCIVCNKMMTVTRQHSMSIVYKCPDHYDIGYLYNKIAWQTYHINKNISIRQDDECVNPYLYDIKRGTLYNFKDFFDIRDGQALEKAIQLVNKLIMFI